jgi:decaprenylphospho-beta-D-ribofuranose 2-oxidase
MLASGQEMVCSPQTHADLFEASCGGMGLTGIITRVRFKLLKIETAYIRQKQIKADNLEELIGLFEQYKHYRYSVAWIDCLQKGVHFGRSILILGEHALQAELPPGKQPLMIPEIRKINLPVMLPSWALNPLTVKAFNFLYYRKNYRKETDRIVSYEPFFYPLDAVGHWNRGYGRKGFVQYQFVIPPDAKKGLVEILNRISGSGMGSFLTVLKVFGRQESMISFPIEGYTLALDFPVREGLFKFLDELDKIVLQYGGRIYLSKDARMKPEIVEACYPQLNKFKHILGTYNPSGKIRSDQSDRLFLLPKY